jgi:Predicted periplasmic protein (DUF2092)
MERFALILALIGPAFAQSAPDIKTILEGVAKAYANQQQYDVVWVTTVEQTSADGKASFKGRSRVAEQDPNKFRLEEEVPSMQMVIIGDGTDVWDVSPATNRYTKHKPADVAAIQGWVRAARTGIFEPPLTLARKAAGATLIGEESIAINGATVACFVIKLAIPDNPLLITYWVEKDRFVIRRLRSELEPSAPLPGVGLTTITEFPVVNLGMPLPDGTFVPSATEVDKRWWSAS